MRAPTDNSNSVCTGQRSELKENLQLYKQMSTLTLFHALNCVGTTVHEGHSFVTCF